MFDPWFKKIPWRGKWKPPPVFLFGKLRGQRSLVGYNPWGHKESDTTEELSARARAHTHTHTHTEQPDHHCIIYALLLLLFSCWVVSYSLQPHELKHFRLLYSPLSLGICSNSCPLSWWCYLTVSSSATHFSICLQSFPVSGSFPMSRLFTWGGQSISTPASVIQHWFPLGWTGLNSLQSKWLSRLFSSTTVQKHEFFGAQPSLWLNSHICTWLLENHSFDFLDLCQ